MTVTDFERDSQIEYKLADEIKAILSRVFIQRDIVADMFEGTDFLTFTVSPFRVGARLRRYEFYEKYPTNFTIRFSRPSGVKTEIHKIREGLVAYLFYGFMNWNESQIIQWFIGDLNLFRTREPTPKKIIPNKDGGSELAVYDLEQFPPAFVVASSGTEEASR